jgi:all-beta uncharacterized protein
VRIVERQRQRSWFPHLPERPVRIGQRHDHHCGRAEFRRATERVVFRRQRHGRDHAGRTLDEPRTSRRRRRRRRRDVVRVRVVDVEPDVSAPVWLHAEPFAVGVDRRRQRDGREITVTGAPSCAWTATSNAAFVTITSGGSGSGSGAVNISVAANSTGAVRTGTITIGNQTFTLTQQSCTYTLSAMNAGVGAGGGSTTIAVSSPSACTWTASSNATFITVTAGAAGAGNGQVTFNVAPNSGFNRSGTVTIARQPVTVSQAGASGPASCVSNARLFSALMSATAGRDTVTVVAPTDCAWTLTTSAAFITVATPSGTGSTGGTPDCNSGRASECAYFSVSANATSAARTGTLTLCCPTFVMTLTQESCVFSVSSKSINVAATGGTGSVTVSSSGSFCNWTAVSNSPFVAISSGDSGAGDGTVTFAVAANDGGTRTGTVTIAGQTVTLTQAGQ